MSSRTRPGHLFTRQQLLDSVWPGRHVEENNLSVQVNALRKVLGNAAIATVPGWGYRFTLTEDSASGARTGRPTLLQAVSPPGPAAARPTNLPDELPPLIGREADMPLLLNLVQDHRLVTVTGAGGTGKTSLARAVLHARRQHHAHGVYFVELAALTEADAVPAAVAAALGTRLADGGDPNTALASALAPLNLLIALDNAEHLVGPVSDLAMALASHAPGVHLLVTSQVRLGVPQEWVYRLGALAVPEPGTSAAAALGFGSVAMFVARASALDHRFVLTDANVASVVALCRQLDGSPLAIELSATRLPTLGLPQLLASMRQRLSLLIQGHRRAPARQQTLRAALEWSHELLSPAERTVFRRMAVFVGSAPLGMVRQVLADDTAAAPPQALDEWGVLEALGGLVDRSLVSLVNPAQDGAGAEDAPRYRLLESPLALATERLHASGEAGPLQARHLRAVHALLEQHCADVLDGRVGFIQVQEALESELGNAQAALAWALQHAPAQALALGSVLSMLIGRRRHAQRRAIWRDLEPLLQQEAAPDAASAAVLARACWQFAEHLGITRPDLALVQAQRGFAFAGAAGDARLQYLTASKIAHSHWRMGHLAGLRDAVATAQPLRQPHWSAYVQLTGSAAQAWLCLMTDDSVGALHWFNEQAALSTLAGIDNALARMNIGRIQLAHGQTREAIDIATEMVERFQGGRNQPMLATAQGSLCIALLASNETSRARDVLTEWLPLAGQFEMQAQWADAAALLAVQEARPRAALLLAGFADAARAATGQAREAADQDRLDRALHAAEQAVSPCMGGTACQRLRSAGASSAPSALGALAFAAEDHHAT
ncbi:winged helix-turn-helix domain-containing protein [Pseudorhodoferax sp.]|uniref:winged helix-turn-helix domain-containing protein n=1 Tax=Pseudorhodoferax sp. TaxID=1993553 RepID=UPI002DD6B6DD|nr:winged helix-turn-helix domain-containing protein [Pseudorhodoferax sp.]